LFFNLVAVNDTLHVQFSLICMWSHLSVYSWSMGGICECGRLWKCCYFCIHEWI